MAVRIHTSHVVTEDVLRDAARIARVGLTLTEHGSRSADHAWDVHLTGASRRRPNSRTRDLGVYAATWDQWGVFLAHLFEVDPDAHCWAYMSATDFHLRTGGRFAHGWPDDAHGDHKFSGIRPNVQGCARCSATMSWQP